MSDKQFLKQASARGRRVIDSKLGRGYSKQHPELLSQYVVMTFLKKEGLLTALESGLMRKLLTSETLNFPHSPEGEKLKKTSELMLEALAILSCSEIGSPMWIIKLETFKAARTRP